MAQNESAARQEEGIARVAHVGLVSDPPYMGRLHAFADVFGVSPETFFTEQVRVFCVKAGMVSRGNPGGLEVAPGHVVFSDMSDEAADRAQAGTYLTTARFLYWNEVDGYASHITLVLRPVAVDGVTRSLWTEAGTNDGDEHCVIALLMIARRRVFERRVLLPSASGTTYSWAPHVGEPFSDPSGPSKEDVAMGMATY